MKNGKEFKRNRNKGIFISAPKKLGLSKIGWLTVDASIVCSPSIFLLKTLHINLGANGTTIIFVVGSNVI